MGERPRHGDAADNADVRAAVWAALTELGATRLLVPCRYGGEGRGQSAAVMLAEMLGSTLYQGPLLDTWTATALLAGTDDNEKLVARIAEGHAVAVAFRERGSDNPAAPPAATVTGSGVTASRRFVGFAAETEYLLVVGTSAEGVRGFVVRADHPSIALRRQDDIARGELYEVRLTGAPIVARTAWLPALTAARIRHAAYLVGVCQGALDAAVGRAHERRQFGQPIGRFQAPAFRLAEAATRLEAARWFVRAVAAQADDGDDASLGSLQALAMTGDLTRHITAVAMQTFGAAGLTDDSEAQLFFRRAAVDAAWLGPPARLRAEAVPLLAARASRA